MESLPSVQTAGTQRRSTAAGHKVGSMAMGHVASSRGTLRGLGIGVNPDASLASRQKDNQWRDLTLLPLLTTAYEWWNRDRTIDNAPAL